MGELRRLDAQAVEARLARIDELLDRVEAVPGPTAEAAIESVQALTEIYGEALARVRDLADPHLNKRLADDELIGHLLVLHAVHPEPADRRVARALDRLAPALRERGAQAESLGVEDGVARVRLTVKGCGGSSATVEEAVREAVLAAAPELTGVRRVEDTERDPAFVPLEALVPGGAGGGGAS
jgi:Fe-S cluster biogenesis protein NfuA